MIKTRKNIVRICCIAGGIVCICIGIYRDEVSEVMNKAVRICLECIGIG